MSNKKNLKSIRQHLADKKSESALYEATELLKSIGTDSPDAAQVLVFRGLALLQLKKNEEAEKSYLHAYQLEPTNPLAVVGLRKLYEQGGDWEKLARLFENQTQTAYDAKDSEILADALKSLLEIRAKHGPEEKLYSTLHLLLPSSPLVGLLQSLTPPKDSYVPVAIPKYPAAPDHVPILPSPLPHPVHLAGSLPLALIILIRTENAIHKKIGAIVENGRKRLKAGSESQVRKNVDREILGTEGMKLIELYKEVGGHPQVDEVVRREVEIREFGIWKRLVACLPSVEVDKTEPDIKPTSNLTSMAKDKPSVELAEPSLFNSETTIIPTKKQALSYVNELADGFVLLGISSKGAEEGWTWVLEGKDEPTLFYDLDYLHKYIKAFPDSFMAVFIEDYCRWYKRPLPETEEDLVMDVPVDDESKKKQSKKSKGGNGAWAKRRVKRERMSGNYAVEDVEQEEREGLISSMTRLVGNLKNSIFAHRVMSRIALQDKDWSNTINFSERGRKLLTTLEAERDTTLPNVKADLDTILGVSLVSSFPPKHHERATRLLKTVLKDYPSKVEARFARAQIYQYAGEWSKAREHFELILDQTEDEQERINTKEEIGWCLVNEGKLEEGREILEEVVETRDSKGEKEKEEQGKVRARAWFRLGRTEWMIGDDESKSHAEDWFMASIRAYPDYASSYSSLGICYLSSTPPDSERALKCFQRAFELDATQADSARRLAIGYADDDEWARVKAIALRVMESEGGLEGVAGGEVLNPKGRFAPHNGWAWKALGATEMHYKNFTKAAEAFQIALRADPEDVSMWVMLGESYVKCGRHMAGLKALNYALTLDPGNWRALYDIGQTQCQLGAFSIAIEAYQKILDMTKGEEIGVIAALAEANLSLGRQTGAGGFRERSRRAFHRSIEMAMNVLKVARSHKNWAWKVIGDATYELSVQESNIEEAQDSFGVIQSVLQYLIEDDADRRSSVPGIGHAANLLQDAISTTTSLQTSVFAFAYRAYLLKNEPRMANSALYDYACALHTFANKSVDGEKKKHSLKTAISVVRTALDRDAGDEKLWNALGVICASVGPQLAQHAFVVSLELYSKDPIVWVNLGYLYLRLNDYELANQCFLKGQVMDPDYARAWFGQGLLAEKNGDKEHAQALFAHSVTLSAQSLLEADLALAASIFSHLLSSSAWVDPGLLLHQPAFALKQYCHQRPDDFAAFHLYALICERLGLVQEAVSSLERATAILEDEFERAESSNIENLYAIALCNLGRVRFSAGKYSESLDTLENCWELIATSNNPGSAALRAQCKGLQGLSYYWFGQIDQSLDALQKSLDEATQSQSRDVKEEVAVLLSRTLWGLGGEEAEEIAKASLMECLSLEKPLLSVISTLAAIAYMSEDGDLMEAIQSELLSRPLSERLQDPFDQSDLVLYLYAVLEGRKEDALKMLEDAFRAAPASGRIRNRLSKAYIKSGKTKEALEVISQEVCSEKGAVAEVKAEEDRLRGIAELSEGHAKGTRRIARSVMLAPWEDEGWWTLAWGKKVTEEAGLCEAEVGTVKSQEEMDG
ncbi:hypothetical protein L204_102085 [Cryptococcus depauperatus]